MDLIALLTGEWEVERTLRDRHGAEGAFRGVARFEPIDGGGLSWTEHGHMRFGGHDGPASRRLAIVGGPAAWEVEFDDGRPFHPLDLTDGTCDVVHHCGDDVYRGSFRLLGRDALDVAWRVTGPRKDDEIRSRYRRASSGSP